MTRQPIHPGEILSDELAELSLSASALARQIKVPPNRISQIIAGQTRHYGRHGFAAGPLVWHEPAVLAEFAEPV